MDKFLTLDKIFHQRSYYQRCNIVNYLLDLSVLGDEEGALGLLDGLVGEGGAFPLGGGRGHRHQDQQAHHRRLHVQGREEKYSEKRW